MNTTFFLELSVLKFQEELLRYRDNKNGTAKFSLEVAFAAVKNQFKEIFPEEEKN